MATLLFALLLALTVVGALGLPGFVTFDEVKGRPYTVTYTNRSLFIDGRPSLFISGSIHPPRSTPAMWNDVMSTAQQNGLNMLEVYIFWDIHEPLEGQFDFSGRLDLLAFLDKCAENNLFVNLRVGPYVCAEWSYGGIPVWVGQKPGMQFRTDNVPWMNAMGNWFTRVINMTRPYLAPNGGPIVLVQVENELAGAPQAYVDWCGTLAATALGADAVPVIMCNGESAKTTINTCNGDNCNDFLEEYGQSGRIQHDQPALWTENEGGFQSWGGSPTHPATYFWGRVDEEITQAVLQWFARGGSHMNYYMYFGGNNYGYSGATVVEAYAMDAPLCPDGLLHEPRYSHISRMHQILATYAMDLLSTVSQLKTPLSLPYWDVNTQKWLSGTQQTAYVYGGVAFVENAAGIALDTLFLGHRFTLPKTSVSIVDVASVTELFNSATIQPSTTHRVVVAAPVSLSWRVWSEPITTTSVQFPSVTSASPVEQLSLTNDETQFLYYERTINVTSTAALPLTLVGDVASAYTAFVDGVYQAQVYSARQDDYSLTLSMSLPAQTLGLHTLTILSESFGIHNLMGPGSGGKSKGIRGAVQLNGEDITTGTSTTTWRMRPSLAGEVLRVSSAQGSAQVTWSSNTAGAPIGSWYQTTFALPAMEDGDVLLFNATGLGRGTLHINGLALGRFWTIPRNDGSGLATQIIYHIPPDWLLPGNNLLTFFEIEGITDLSKAHLVVSRMVPGQAVRVPWSMTSCEF